MVSCTWLVGASSAFADDGGGAAVDKAAAAQKPAPTLPAVEIRASGRTDAPDLSTPIRTGSRLGLSSLDTPASVETLGGEQIRARGDTTVNDAVTRAAGFATDAAPGNGGTSVSVRGFSGPESITTLYDGTRMYPGAGTVTFPFDTWSVDRIEVLRGPASVLYGEGGIGGVINVVPKAPQRDYATTVQLGAGAYGEKRAALDTTGALGSMLSYRFYVSDVRSNGWVPRGDSHTTALGGALRLDVDPRLSFSLDYDYGRQKPARYFGVPVADGALNPAFRYQNYNVADSAISYYDQWTRLNATWRATPGFTVRNQLYYLLTNRHWHDSESYALQPDGDVLRNDYIEILHHQRQIGDQLDATVDGRLWGHQNRLVVGADFNVISFVDTSNSPFDGSSVVPAFGFAPGLFDSPDPTVPAFRTVTHQASLFAEDRLELTDRLSWVSGLRYDHIAFHRDTFATATTAAASFDKTFAHTGWRTGLVFALTPALSVYGQYTTGTDGVSSLITLSQSSSPFTLSTGQQWEAGIKQEVLGGRGSWTFAVYQIVKRNLVSADPLNPDLSEQVGRQSSRGIEWSGALQLGGGWSVAANAALLRARYDDFVEAVDGQSVSRAGNVPYNIPEQTANVWLDWAFAPGWRAGAGVQYVGRRFGDNANSVAIPSYTLVDASASWRATRNLTLALYLRNLTNRTYAVSTQNDGTEWLLGAPRSGWVTATMTF
ncbi:TonB-dependent receptor [Burkholderia multivorans]|nr:TonB-dependent receptor [Burkholderia multivorans]